MGETNVDRPGIRDDYPYRDYVRELYQVAMEFNPSTKSRFASAGSSWFASLAKVVRAIDTDVISPITWQDAILERLRLAKVECLPGRTRSRQVTTKFMRLSGDDETSTQVLTQSRDFEAVISSQLEPPTTLPPRRLNFGQPFPFATVPDVIRQGYKEYKGRYPNHAENRKALDMGGKAKGDGKQGEHFDRLWYVLQQRLSSMKVQLLLLIACTLSAAKPLPWLAKESTDDWIPNPNSTSNTSWGFLMVIRMMWMTFPDLFPEQGDNKVLGRAEMVKKIGE